MQFMGRILCLRLSAFRHSGQKTSSVGRILLRVWHPCCTAGSRRLVRLTLLGPTNVRVGDGYRFDQSLRIGVRWSAYNMFRLAALNNLALIGDEKLVGDLQRCG